MLDTTSTDGQLSLDFDTKPPATDWRDEVPSVSQLTRRVRGHLEASFAEVWVRGEISNFRKPVSGHAYFILKDANAQLKAVMFRPAISKVKFQVADGMEILLHGKLTVYEARGEYQLVADAMEPVGVGALQLAFEQLKAKLNKEGLFDRERKRKLPFLPRRIGVITSPTGAAVRDILNVLARRSPGTPVVVIPAAVQGEKAAPEIVQALGRAEAWNATYPEKPIDVLIVGRGGGSLEDLWPFNEEIVARALAKCPIPTISAVGHEIDFTIADFVADLRAPTPSAAAEIVTPAREDLCRQLDVQKRRLWISLKKRLEQTRLHLGHLSSRLVDPRQRVRAMKTNYTLMLEKLVLAMRSRVKIERQRVDARVQRLDALSPLKVIARGYSLTYAPDGKLLHSVEQTPVGSRVRTRLADGEVESEVVATHRSIP